MKISLLALLLMSAAGSAALEERKEDFRPIEPLDANEVSVRRISGEDAMYEATVSFAHTDSEFSQQSCGRIPAFITALSDPVARTAIAARLGSAALQPHTFIDADVTASSLPAQRLISARSCVAKCFSLPDGARPVRISLSGTDGRSTCATLPSEMNRSYQSESADCSDGTMWREIVSLPVLEGRWVVCAASISNAAPTAQRLAIEYKVLRVRQIGRVGKQTP